MNWEVIWNAWRDHIDHSHPQSICCHFVTPFSVSFSIFQPCCAMFSAIQRSRNTSKTTHLSNAAIVRTDVQGREDFFFCHAIPKNSPEGSFIKLTNVGDLRSGGSRVDSKHFDEELSELNETPRLILFDQVTWLAMAVGVAVVFYFVQSQSAGELRKDRRESCEMLWADAVPEVLTICFKHHKTTPSTDDLLYVTSSYHGSQDHRLFWKAACFWGTILFRACRPHHPSWTWAARGQRRNAKHSHAQLGGLLQQVISSIPCAQLEYYEQHTVARIKNVQGWSDWSTSNSPGAPAAQPCPTQSSAQAAYCPLIQFCRTLTLHNSRQDLAQMAQRKLYGKRSLNGAKGILQIFNGIHGIVNCYLVSILVLQ